MMREFTSCFRRYQPQTRMTCDGLSHLCVGGLLVLLMTGFQLRGDDLDSTAKERSQAFEWFSKLGYADVKDAKLVRVATEEWNQVGDDPPIHSYRYGFLIRQKDNGSTIFFLDVITQPLARSTPDAEEDEQPDFEIVDFPELAAANAKEPNLADYTRRDGLPRRFGERLSERAEIFVLAWACSRKGEDELAAKLYDRAAALPSRRGDERTPKNLQQQLAADLAHAEMWRAVEQFGEPEISREQLLAKFDWIVKNFPESEHFARAKETATLLKQMVQEDQEHAKQRKAGKALVELSEKEQIAELIFQLRDQNGHQWSQPGSCDIFNTSFGIPHGKEDSPAHQLLRIGYGAVPQLIEALDDERFTRSVGFHRAFYFSHHVLRVNDCAERILTRIAGREFTSRRDHGPASIKHDVSNWYERLQQKGEKTVLLEETAAGGARATQLAASLVKKYPDDALPALINGIGKTDNPWQRAELVRWIGEIQGDEPISFLLKELKNGPKRSSRLVAALALHERGREEAVAAMIAEWNRPYDEKIDDYSWREEDLISFLASCGQVEAIKALGHNWSEQPAGIRLEIVSAFGTSDSKRVLSYGTGGTLRAGESSPDKRSPKLRAAMLKLLLAALDDTDERTGMFGMWGNESFPDPRICDVAGHVLHNIDATRYAFDLSASQRKRDRARFVLKNALRQELGLAAVPIPASRTNKPVPDEIVGPLLARFETATGELKAESESKILQLGLGAFAPVVKQRDQLSVDDPQRPQLERLARRLSLLVVDVEVAEKSLPLEPALAKELAEWKGKPLEIKAFQELVSKLTDNLPEEGRGLRLAAVRDAAGDGVTVRLDLLNRKRTADVAHGTSVTPGPAARADRPYSWSCSQSVRLGKKTLLRSTGAGTRPPGTTEDVEFTELFHELVSAAPEKPFEVRLEMIGVWKE